MIRRPLRGAPVPALLLMLILAACAREGVMTLHPESSAAASSTVDGVRYDAQTERLAGDTLRTRVTLTNTSSAPVELTVPGGCPVLVRAYATEAREGEAVWDQGAAILCTMELRLVRLEPNGSETFDSPAFDAAQLRAIGLASGRYYLTGVITPEQQRIELAAGAIDL